MLVSKLDKSSVSKLLQSANIALICVAFDVSSLLRSMLLRLLHPRNIAERFVDRLVSSWLISTLVRLTQSSNIKEGFFINESLTSAVLMDSRYGYHGEYVC